ncbi:MAG: OsmC family protein [Candidatus Thioglobus sp.]|jgi:putative redox protein|nr:OsmC family protein [Candidatus Pseudothioglobus aerophilus]MBT3439226.1 OsmC family protein [Gammaproteobacteria bacterium]MDP0559567.1 OsmC family protein [Candidatus Thioglobus sp.]MBT4245420.1 OsmC family protein [Gammaproteobacteria bacterium]MBT4586937.1 OsmC family protein [Gammaproteobacteria bacterium]
MNLSVNWVDGMLMVGKSHSGHSITMDGPIEIGGENLGVRPMEMLLLGVAGCTMIDVVTTLQKMRQDLSHCETRISAERANEHPKVFTDIHIKFIVKGKDLDSKKVDKAITLSAEKYCSASIMLGKTAKITHDFEVLE